MGNNSMPPLPPGATLFAPPAAGSAAPPLPPGATSAPPPLTSPPEEGGSMAKMVGEALAGPLIGGTSALAKMVGWEGPEDFEKGVGEGGLKTAAGVSRMLHLPTTPSLEAAGTVGPTTGEHIGDLAENIGEFIASGEVAKGISGFFKLATKYPQLIQLLEQYPKASRFLMNAIQGGAQAVVKSEGEGKAQGEVVKQGAAGAAGAAVSSAAVENAAPAARWAARKVGMGGLTSLEALVKAGRAYVGEQNWDENVKLATPRLVDEVKAGTIKTVGDFVDAIDRVKNRLWTGVIQPQVDRHAAEMIDGAPIAQKIRARITPGMVALPNVFKSEVDAIQRIASDFDNFRFNLKDANTFLVDSLNPKLQSFYKMSAEARRAAGLTDGEVAALEEAADGLRDEIYTKLENLGEQTPREFRKEYGALKQMSRVFEKRATVDARQAPLNLPQALSAAGGIGIGLEMLLRGEPLGALAAVTPFVATTIQKSRQAPASLIRQGLKAGAEEINGPGVVSKVTKGVARAAVPVAGRVAGSAVQEDASGPYVRFTASDGSIHEVPEDQLDAARKIDPGLHVVEPKE